MEGIHVKTENHYSKRRRTQIIHIQVGVEEMPLFGNLKLDNEGKTVPVTWDKPTVKKKVIHHTI